MKRLIFLNLLIDRFWARGSLLDKIFNISNPESLRLSLLSFNLALNYRDVNTDYKQDLYLLTQDVDLYWKKTFSSFHQLDQMNYFILKDDPYLDTEWVNKLSTILSNYKIQKFVFSGISNLEQALISKFALAKNEADVLVLQKKLNFKGTLLDLAKSEDVLVPHSQSLLGRDLDFSKKNYMNKIFKFDMSSGGGGQFDAQKIEMLFKWSESRGLKTDWNDSVWLCQDRIQANREWSLFSHTLWNTFQVAEVLYDQNHLSNQHIFNKKQKNLIEIENIHNKVKTYLIRQGYSGYFGLDLIQDSNDKIFVVDLNVRLTKTHLLSMAIEKWSLIHSLGVFYRKKFVLKKNINFEFFWKKFCKDFALTEKGECSLGRVLPFDVFGFSLGQSEITFFIDVESKELIKQAVERIDNVIKGMDL